MKSATPVWLGRELESLFRRNYLREHIHTSALSWESLEWDGCFGLRNIAPDEHPCSIMNLELKLAREILPPLPAIFGNRCCPRTAERFMRSLSHGVGMCMAAKASSVRVSNERKRKSAAASGEEGGDGSD